ncbi:hypothetical protein BU14_0342s0004 [Porphyra umbilicalis]|uniref:Ubiquitin-like domain-containing protein n=1 Tax=Porphyra umbilicalis TaxID=2786 RepID=A0A1X6NXY2_PORUM|nr:hypothetical protein BU14_0342s0004 [Porphyra umbilicalis]|eukprot:OSX73484.1 hypothetical protein BU14_0342s0004 [Porphyra umbilicalis]
MRLLVRSTLTAPRGVASVAAVAAAASSAASSPSTCAASSPSTSPTAASAAAAPSVTPSAADVKTPSSGSSPHLPTRLLEVEADDLVDTALAKAAAAFDISRPERLCLVTQTGRRLRSGRTLREYGLGDGGVLRLTRRQATTTCVIHIRF